jgi:hypothetical protein
MSRKAIGRRTIVATALSAPLLASTAGAQGAWPTKPVRIVVPFNPGGAIDALVRVIADGLTTRLGQQVLVDPKPGANTIQKLMTSPVVDSQQHLLGVIQICRKSLTQADAGPDFSLNDLQNLETAARIVAKLPFMNSASN